MSPRFYCMKIIALLVSISHTCSYDLNKDFSEACPHQSYPESSSWVNITGAPSIYNSLSANHSDFYYYEDYHLKSNMERKLILRLEPCKGIVYLFVRKTRPCWPNPYSCIDLNTGSSLPDCAWTHYKSTINGSQDGVATVLEVPLTSTQWYITVFAKSNSKYSLTVISDTSQYPRVGSGGVLSATQNDEKSASLLWSPAFFDPNRNSFVTQYIVYTSTHYDTLDTSSNPHLIVSTSRIMNTVCGLKENTDHPYSIVTCGSGACSANITGLVNGRKYIFNVIADSSNGIQSAYSGMIMTAKWDNSKALTNEEIVDMAGIVIGSVLVILLTSYLLLYLKYA